MTIQALQEFIGRHSVASGALTALAAALDAKVSGTPLDPLLGRHVGELLQQVGGGQLLDDLEPQQASTMLAFIRAFYLIDGKLLYAATRSRAWDYAESEILENVGCVARMHAQEFTRVVVPACKGLAERLSQPGARLIDVGTGVAGTAIALTRMWPEMSVVGIDPWQPSLRLARENVDAAGVGDRIELREQGVEALDDRDAYDAAWFPLPFIPERLVRAGLERILRALRPGGWIAINGNSETMPQPMAALMMLRMAQFGGPLWTPAEIGAAARESGFVDIHTVPTSPGSVVTWVVGRRG